ncbi:MAG TPA: dihydrofolate reductase [Halieaceae bacterium]|jgi:dihydrofolate reductase|uniref:dihydrofolate reductase n=1 Tax=Haliea TaxID=475794 RepID=UPI000C682F48|nr:dihydrofolate reductase [Haliea sp.]HBM83807.1 dihydrofolate reductase [Halieaceae bacterium]MAY92477.1 dihydrofolate reductase [Haliea sp.]MBK40895.1 dihydrofolate reductase [Haliea sp.]MBP68530.1 dihydrofolate reductase [Haliea sp.]HBQ39861.1 dihydrofolate reductase [Halieaceae bacterium]|tara:strand:+ start:25322 stop:25849 length:528 start_codon:yes stop_codon:yes gene_type:complete
MSVRIALMVAVAANGVIGRDNALPWHLPDDLQYFRRTTMGKPVVMGRKTFESIGRPLPGRPNIVVTATTGWRAEGVAVANSVPAALTLAAELAQVTGAEELVVIGGATIYAAALPLAQRLYVTEVHADIEGDTWFAPVDAAQWREISREERPATEDNLYPYAFVCFERRQIDGGS